MDRVDLYNSAVSHVITLTTVVERRSSGDWGLGTGKQESGSLPMNQGRVGEGFFVFLQEV